MRPAARRALIFAIGLLIAAMVGCLVIGGWLERRKHDLSGVPGGHYAVSENGRAFYVPRGGPPIGQRPQVALTAERYRLWEEYDRSSSRWGSAGVLCFFAAAGLAAWVRLAEPGRESTTEPPPHPTAIACSVFTVRPLPHIGGPHRKPGHTLSALMASANCNPVRTCGMA